MSGATMSGTATEAGAMSTLEFHHSSHRDRVFGSLEGVLTGEEFEDEYALEGEPQSGESTYENDARRV